MANLQPENEVLIIADSRTPKSVTEAFFGEALAMGATAQVLLVPTPPPPSLQTGLKWSKTVHAATTTPDLIVDLAIGYADFIMDAVKRGARVISPGDGTGNIHLEDTLMRTIGAVDIRKLRRESELIADLLTKGSSLRITSDEGTDITIDITGLVGNPNDGFLWDPDKKEWRNIKWVLLPPSQPGLVLPTGSSNGVIAADGFILYEPAYNHETPKSPLRIRVEKSWITEISGDPLTSTRLKNWLESFAPDKTPYHGPVHCNIGTNPRAMLTQHQEFERLRGTITFGWGDNSMLGSLKGQTFGLVKSPVHWDCMILRPTLYIDNRKIIDHGVMPSLV